MIDPELAGRVRVFLESVAPGVEGFHLLIRFNNRVEMVGANFGPEVAVEVMEGMITAREQGEYPAPTIN